MNAWKGGAFSAEMKVTERFLENDSYLKRLNPGFILRESNLLLASRNV